MWQSPSQKIRTGGKKSRRGQERKRIHVSRANAEIRVVSDTAPEGSEEPGSEIKARLLLNDITPKGVGVFCNRTIPAGTAVAIAVDNGSTMIIKGKVAWCQETEHPSHVITEVRFTYRIGIKFTFATAQDEAAVKKYCDEVTRALMPNAA